MLLQPGSKPILKSSTGEQAALVSGVLPVDVECRCPPLCRAIFEFRPVAHERVEVVRTPHNGTHSNLQRVDFLHVMVISNEVRLYDPFLGQGYRGEKTKR